MQVDGGRMDGFARQAPATMLYWDETQLPFYYGLAKTFCVGDDEMSDDIRWIRSYVLEEGGGSVGTVCIYEASSPEAIREHASRADLPVDEIIAIADTVVVRPDPAPASA